MSLMSRAFAPIAVVAALALPTMAPASEKLAKELGGRLISWSDLKPRTVALSIATSGNPDSSAAMQASSDGSTRRPVIVDGIWMELPEGVIVGMIKLGAFIVVYPGTNVPWDPNNPRHPTYPPDWVPHF